MAAKHRESYTKRIERLERENERLRDENKRLRDAQRFLPPESFCLYYGLLVEAIYLTKQPEPEVKTHELRRWGSRVPIRNWTAYRFKRRVDKRLSKIKGDIYDFLDMEV